MNYIKLLLLVVSFHTVHTSFPDIDYVNSFSGTDISFVQRHEVGNLTKKDVEQSNDTLDKLDISIKDDLIRTWIESTSIYRMNT